MSRSAPDSCWTPSGDSSLPLSPTGNDNRSHLAVTSLHRLGKLQSDPRRKMSSQPITYPSLFPSASEFPAFFVPYRWWEDEAVTVLWTFDIREIGRAIRFGLFKDHNLPRAVLQSRNGRTVDDFLLTLLQPPERAFIGNLSHVQKVEEILRRSQTAGPASTPWDWFPSNLLRHLDALTIAARIDAESHLHFREIPFEEWVRYSLGYPAPSVQWFLLQHTAFAIHLSDHFEAYPEDIPKYWEVEKHLRNRSPIAHRAILHCLPRSPDRDSRHPLPSPGFQFITLPIQKLFRAQPACLPNLLKTLSILAIRFRRTYISVSEMDWTLLFDTNLPFADDLLASICPEDLAHALTHSDEIDFASLTRQHLVTEHPTVAKLHAKWHTLSLAVWECCTALPHLVRYIQDGANVLHHLRNYFSLTATLHGLRTYSLSRLCNSNVDAVSAVTIDPAVPPSLLYLLDASGNYAAYRDRRQAAPGIPFLIPHIREYQQHGETSLKGLFPGK